MQALAQPKAEHWPNIVYRGECGGGDVNFMNGFMQVGGWLRGQMDEGVREGSASCVIGFMQVGWWVHGVCSVGRSENE